MHYASINNISKSFGVRELFRGITFHVEEGDKIALIARNGFGKTTLLQILLGNDTPDQGDVWIHKDIQVIFLEQEQRFDPLKSIWDNVLSMNHPVAQVVKRYEEFLEKGSADATELQRLLNTMDELHAWSFEHDMQQILSRLKITNLNQKISALSGGQKKRVALAQCLIAAKLHEGKCLLILDEPTNHLDVAMIEWLEDYLNKAKITLLMVTHDRYFLDAVCNEIIEIDQQQVYIHQGNYDYFLEQKAHRNEVASSELLKDKNIYRKELEWMRKQPKARTTKSKSRQDNFTDVEQRVKQKVEDLSVQLQVKMTRLGGKILEMKKVYKNFGDKKILAGFDYTFKRGERIGIVGKNGVGKSTFLQIALQLMEPDSGKVNHGDTVVFGHFSQEGLTYKEDKRVVEYVKSFAEFFQMADGTKISAAKFLERFAFTPEQQYTYLSLLSGGEKRRLQLLTILYKSPNFLVLDEPTNDLDLQTLQLLEEFLLDYPGCLLLVSHDRYFMDKLVDHLFVFEGDGIVRDFPGNYSQYRIEEENKQPILDTKENQDNNDFEEQKRLKKEKEKEKKLSYKEKRELEDLEKEMPALEQEKSTLEAHLGSSGLSYDELQKTSERIQQIIHQLEEKEMRWLELSEKS
ncbi:MAG: ABC-F family ATP-binding cassette domain-containing protein [Chitinophagaceae bacterium]|nr:ABC-F family ATP-binding cassette domain-containing protein [Chitinophagaceae bacterium]